MLLQAVPVAVTSLKEPSKVLEPGGEQQEAQGEEIFSAAAVYALSGEAAVTSTGSGSLQSLFVPRKQAKAH